MVFGKSKGEKLLAIIICRSTAGAARIKKPAGKSGPGHLAESGPQKRRKGRIILGLGILDKQDFAFFCRKFLEPAHTHWQMPRICWLCMVFGQFCLKLQGVDSLTIFDLTLIYL